MGRRVGSKRISDSNLSEADWLVPFPPSGFVGSFSGAVEVGPEMSEDTGMTVCWHLLILSPLRQLQSHTFPVVENIGSPGK